MIEVRTTKTRGLSFVVKSQSGRVLLHSVEFKTQGEIEKTVKLLTSLTGLTNNIERKTNVDGKFLFSIKNNNDIIAHSGLFSSEAGMENGIKNLKNLLSEI